MKETYHTIDRALSNPDAMPPDEPLCFGGFGIIVFIAVIGLCAAFLAWKACEDMHGIKNND